MKNKYIALKKDNMLNFYFIYAKKKYYLFTQEFSKGVYDYFRKGRAENEVRSFCKWGKNPRLDKTIEKIPMYVTYVMKEIV